MCLILHLSLFQGARVILACRNETKAEAARTEIVAETGNENVEVRKLDLASLQSVRDFAKKFNQGKSYCRSQNCNFVYPVYFFNSVKRVM